MISHDFNELRYLDNTSNNLHHQNIVIRLS